MNFKKMHGLGNDFVILDFRGESKTLTPEQIQHICHRNFGVGCDLLTILEPSNNADIFARFYNADGSESAACGNATRCVADIVMKERGSTSCAIETGRGVLSAESASNGLITINMGAALSIEEIPSPDTRLPSPVTINMGNPHCVFFLDDLNAIAPTELGPQIESNLDLFPERTNVEFCQIVGDNKIRQITWERGCGITLACGSGACATAIAAQHKGLIERKTEIILDGGSLFIELNAQGEALMTGPVAYVFDGELKV
ncbi:MAG: diaminopimelate epimerase [Alphaproteobacteria bacterium]